MGSYCWLGHLAVCRQSLELSIPRASHRIVGTVHRNRTVGYSTTGMITSAVLGISPTTSIDTAGTTRPTGRATFLFNQIIQHTHFVSEPRERVIMEAHDCRVQWVSGRLPGIVYR